MVKKIVLDTSVVIAGILGNRTSQEILLEILKDKLIILISPEVLNEYRAASHYPKILSWASIYFLEYIIGALQKKGKFINPEISTNLCRDKKDNMFFDLAIAGKAFAIITWDKDILSLRDDQNSVVYMNKTIYILTPTEFISIRKHEK